MINIIMSIICEYSIGTDFTNAIDVNLTQLHEIIKLQITTIDRISRTGDDVTIIFSEITNDQRIILNNIVSGYVYTLPINSENYDAIVDSNGNGNYLLPSEAFADGHVSIFVRNGIYQESQNIAMPDYGSITGESGGNVVIHFMGLPHGIVADGSGSIKQSQGTISINNLGKTVTGSGTIFTNLNPNDFIRIGTNFYKIASITDDTHLELVDTYYGNVISDIQYIAQNMLTGITLKRIIITGSSSTGLLIRACWHFTVLSVAIKQNYPNMQILDSGDSAAQHVLIENGSGSHGLFINNCVSISFDTVDIYNNEGNGIDIDGYTESLIFKSCESTNNGNTGLNIEGECIDSDFIACAIKSNVNSGIYLGSNTKNISLSQITSRNNGTYGINIHGVEHNITSNFCNSNNNGVNINASDCVVSGNICCRNNTGINISTNSNDNILVDNVIKYNNVLNLEDLGVGTIISNNKV